VSEDIAQQWLAGMVGVSLQFSVLAAVVAALVFALRSLTPRVRYLVWLFVLLRLAIPVGVSSPFGALPSALPRAAVTNVSSGNPVSPGELPETSTRPERLVGSAMETFADVSLAFTLFIAWAAVVLCLSAIQMTRSTRRRIRIRSAMETPSPELAQRIEALRAEIGLRRAVSAWIVHHDLIEGPAIQGWLRPRVLLPSSMVRVWRREELEPVLLHELVHLKRKDPIARAVGNFLQIVYFFHPAVWWVNSRLREEREKACDDTVVHRRLGDKRMYVRALLRLVEERFLAAATPELRMATARRPLARRIRRLLEPRYRPRPKVGGFAFAGLLLGIGLGLALSTEALAPAKQEQTSKEIQARMVWLGAFFVESIDEIADAERVEIGGDFTLGRPATPVKPDAEELAASHPLLFRRLEELGQLSVKLIIDREGRVRLVRFEGDVDEDLKKPFVDVLNAARFAPTAHHDRGPAMVEMQVAYFVNPAPRRRSFYEKGQELTGREVAEILRVVSDTDAPEAIPVRDGLPRYVAILEKGEAPVLDTVPKNDEIILSFGLRIDAHGNVESVGLFRDSRTALNEVSPSTPVSEALIPYLETFRFEPLVLSDGSPAQGTVVVDVRVSMRGAEIATRAAASNEELDRRISDVYRLTDDQSIDLRPPPHPPERMVLYRTGSPGQARVQPGGPSQMTILWKGDRLTYGGSCFGCDDLVSLLMNLGVRRDAVRFEGDAENVRIEADIVKREEASEEELFAGLSAVLRQRFDLDLTFEHISEATETLVLRGSIGTVPLDDDREGQRVVHVFTDEKNEDPRFGAGGGPFLNTDIFVKLLSSQLGMPVVDETTTPPAETFYVHFHDSAHGTRRFELLIRNVESQTDLDITVEQRLDDFLVVSKSAR
jgi:beta-lactamase regulating signal transducer with metallopeptidase domain